ncbi:hypothetical protein BC826DRAFT_970659 [Russula brevipes]|nr:hypothetical protein BC826DRAFT_970659 [Russula brevipes]
MAQASSPTPAALCSVKQDSAERCRARRLEHSEPAGAWHAREEERSSDESARACQNAWAEPRRLWLRAAPPPPARPSVSPSNETGERAVGCACGGSPSTATTRGGTRANVCSAPRTSPKSGSERFVVKRKERAASRAGQPAFSIVRTALPGRLDFGERRRVECTRCTHELGRAGGMLLDRKGVDAPVRDGMSRGARRRSAARRRTTRTISCARLEDAVAPCAIAAPPRTSNMGALSARSEGARLFRRVLAGRERGLAEGGPPLRTTYLVVSLDDRDIDELTSGDSGVGWELVVCGVDEGGVSEVVG